MGWLALVHQHLILQRYSQGRAAINARDLGFRA
jgi:hypothetical protein